MGLEKSSYVGLGSDSSGRGRENFESKAFLTFKVL